MQLMTTMMTMTMTMMKMIEDLHTFNEIEMTVKE